MCIRDRTLPLALTPLPPRVDVIKQKQIPSLPSSPNLKRSINVIRGDQSRGEQSRAPCAVFWSEKSLSYNKQHKQTNNKQKHTRFFVLPLFLSVEKRSETCRTVSILPFLLSLLLHPPTKTRLKTVGFRQKSRNHASKRTAGRSFITHLPTRQPQQASKDRRSKTDKTRRQIRSEID